MALALLAVAALVEAVSLLLRPGLPRVSRYDRAVVMDRAAFLDGGGKVLVFGDSAAGAGVDPELLSKSLGAPVRLASVAARVVPAAGHHLLGEALARGVRPAAMVIVLTPYYFDNVLPIDLYAREFETPLEVWQLWRAGAVTGEQALRLCLFSLPSLRYRQVLQSMAGLEDWKTKRLQPPSKPGQRGRGRGKGRSATAAARRPVEPPIRDPEFDDTIGKVRDKIARKTFAPSPYVRFYLNRMLDRTAKERIPVYLALAPLYEGLTATAHQREFFRAGEAYFRRLAAEHAGVSLLFERSPLFAAREMGNNHVHLGARGKPRYTAMLAERLCAAGSGLPIGCRAASGSAAVP